ncbi:MAG TPA: fused MFS/spermidine synthase [Vicinamibacterales bacterium]|nr:fused MFS/spermidine synthase [Vicinamibacterales bacterium]
MNARRYMPALLLLFVGSGCAALIYEIVWFQLLQLVIGSSAISLGVLLGTFMGGMCLGSLLFSRYVGGEPHPLRVYAYLELGIGALGLLILFGMPVLSSAYTSLGTTGIAGLVLRGIAAAICLLPPTFLMGATLPAIARWVKSTPEGMSWLGFFYGGNIAGGVLGCLLAGFYLLRVHDMAIATYAAVVLNVLVAVVALVLARSTPYEMDPDAAARPTHGPTDLRTQGPSGGAWAVYTAIALSGFTALGSEVLWTRTLSLLFGATTYTFSLILAVFLFGLGIGSSIGSAMAGRIERPRLALGWCQMLLCAAMAWTSYMLTRSLPYWPINPSINSSPEGIWYTFQLDVVRALWAMLPAAILWGASFPLALASVASGRRDPARVVGGIYAANTLGAIVGAVGGSLLLTIWLGTQKSQQMLIVVSAISALISLDAAFVESDAKKRRLQFAGTLLLAAAMAGAVLLARTVTGVPPILVAYGRYAATRVGESDIIYMGEGWNASVAVSRLSNGVLNYHNAGKVQASSEPQDMRLQRMLGHLTTLIPKNPGNALVIGCGAGVTAGAVSIDPAVRALTIAEIEPLVPSVVSKYFSEHNFSVVTNPKTRIHIDDARHFLMTTDETFDAITSDPLDPWVKGAAMLYSREFFETVKQRLNPGGVVTLFVQLYESNTEAVKSEVATFLEAFPNGMIFGNTNNGAGYDMVLLGQVEPTVINLDEMQVKLAQPEYAAVSKSFAEIGMNSVIDLFATFAGNKPQLQPWLADATINRDRSLRLQYLAGLGVHLYQSDVIYAGMLRHATYPDGTFTGSPGMLGALQEAMRQQHGR